MVKPFVLDLDPFRVDVKTAVSLLGVLNFWETSV